MLKFGSTLSPGQVSGKEAPKVNPRSGACGTRRNHDEQTMLLLIVVVVVIVVIVPSCCHAWSSPTTSLASPSLSSLRRRRRGGPRSSSDSRRGGINLGSDDSNNVVFAPSTNEGASDSHAIGHARVHRLRRPSRGRVVMRYRGRGADDDRRAPDA